MRRNIRLPRIELHILSLKEYHELEGSKWVETMDEEGIRIL
ncbi:MAG: hypothetical protein ACPL4E_10860 [Thermoproteota archaeon]